MLETITFQDFITSQKRESFDPTTVRTVQSILKDVRKDGDQAVRDFTKRFDGVELVSFQVTEQEIQDAYNRIDKTLIKDLELAFTNIVRFHKQQLPTSYTDEILPGSTVGQLVVPIESVGIYVPGGTAAYPSTVLMNAAPAIVAGVENIIMISPPNKEGRIADIILAAAKVAGITSIYKVGGAQGIGALAYGTNTIPKVDKIVGPGNIYVALAKREVFGVVGIDMIAGPSEILIYADDTANPRFVASDLLSQAEHDTLARAILITTSETLIDKVNEELELQLETLERKDIARTSLLNEGKAILVSSEEEAIKGINTVAPEHLELLVENANQLVSKIRNAGAIFVGPYSPEPLGDYIAGPNHTLPTSTTARYASALGTQDFVKRISVIQFSEEGLQTYKDSIIRIADKEGLTAHANAVKRRFEE
jgi:histidinol dehydrogenase